MNREELFDKYLQRSLTPEETAELKALLQGSPAAGRELVEHINEASLIVRLAGRMHEHATAEEDSAASPAPIVAAKPSARPPWRWAIAAGLAFLAALAWFLRPNPLPLNATLMAASAEVTIQRRDQSLAAEPGLHLMAGDIVQTPAPGYATIVFEGEAARVELRDGTKALFNTTAHARVLNLTEGSVEAVLSPSSKQRASALTMRTLHGEARSGRGRFLLASETSSTRLEVSSGEVQFTHLPERQTLAVRAGQTASASPNHQFAVRPFLPEAWRSKDIGAVGLRGAARFDGQCFRLQGAGQDTCCAKDQFQFTYQTLPGDGEILAQVRQIEFTDPEAKAMLMIRQTLKSASPQVSLGVTASGGLELEYRARTDSRIERPGHAGTPCWLRLVRQGDVITTFHSANGADWTLASSHTNSFAGPAFIGLGVTSYNHAALSTAVFDQVRVTPESIVPSDKL
jgi:ferric-dicitrate binding protein FerR (iron transport regulator)